MLTNHTNPLVPEHSWDLHRTLSQGPRKMGKTRKIAEKEEKMVIKGTGGSFRQ